MSSKHGLQIQPAHVNAATDVKQDSAQRIRVEGPDLRGMKPQRCEVEVIVARSAQPRAPSPSNTQSLSRVPSTLRRATWTPSFTEGNPGSLDPGLEGKGNLTLESDDARLIVEDRMRLFAQEPRRSEEPDAPKQRGRSVPASRENRSVDDEPAPRRVLADLLRLDEEQRLKGVRPDNLEQ